MLDAFYFLQYYTQFRNNLNSLIELNMRDSFLFDASTQNPEIIIERATGRKINYMDTSI